MRSTKKDEMILTDQTNHVKYCSNSFLSFIEKTREHFLQGEGWKGGDPVDYDHMWINWQVRLMLLLLFGCVGIR